MCGTGAGPKNERCETLCRPKAGSETTLSPSNVPYPKSQPLVVSFQENIPFQYSRKKRNKVPERDHHLPSTAGNLVERPLEIKIDLQELIAKSIPTCFVTEKDAKRI